MSTLLDVLELEGPLIQIYCTDVIKELLERDHPYWKYLGTLFRDEWECMRDIFERLFLELGSTFPERGSFNKWPVDLKEHEQKFEFAVGHIRSFLFKKPENKELNRKFFYDFFECYRHLCSYFNIIINEKAPDNLIYCCPLQCFPKLPFEDEVDGMACRKCKSYSRCHCGCKTHMKYMNENYCCSKFCCQPTVGICLLCPGACLCKCEEYREKMMDPESDMVITEIDVNRSKTRVESVPYKGEKTHCCAQKCIPIPPKILRGLACKQCEAVNYCKCYCLSWPIIKIRYSRHYCPLTKPEDGWESVRLEDVQGRGRETPPEEDSSDEDVWG